MTWNDLVHVKNGSPDKRVIHQFLLTGRNKSKYILHAQRYACQRMGLHLAYVNDVVMLKNTLVKWHFTGVEWGWDLLPDDLRGAYILKMNIRKFFDKLAVAELIKSFYGIAA